MRAGSAFRRCTRDRCRARVAASARACPKCGGHSISWAFVIDLTLPGSKRKQRFGSGFPTKAAALEAMNRLQAAVVDGTHVERSRRTLGAYLEDWLAARNDIRANTARDYSVSIHNHIGPRLGDVPLQAVDRLRIRGLYRQLAESGLVEKTVHNVHVCLRKALQDAVEDGLLRRNPAERAHAKPKDRPEMRTWSADELATFLAFTAAAFVAKPPAKRCLRGDPGRARSTMNAQLSEPPHFGQALAPPAPRDRQPRLVHRLNTDPALIASSP